MMRWISLPALALAFILAAPVHSFARPGLPDLDGSAALASVNGEPILLEEFLGEFAAIHREAGGRGGGGTAQDPDALLERLIDIRLILQEATNIGLDELPHVQRGIASQRTTMLRNLLFRRHLEGVGVDDAEVERLYREAVEEMSFTSVLIADAGDARTFEARLAAGDEFDRLIEEYVEQDKAKPDLTGQYLKTAELLPEVSEIVMGLQLGEISPAIEVRGKHTILRLDDVRVPDLPEVREQIESDELRRARDGALRKYADELKERHAVVDQELYDGLDFDSSEEEFSALLEDSRPIATLEGEPPVTVGELARALEKRFFHGIKGAIEEKKINQFKYESLDELLVKRVVIKEAEEVGIEETAEFRTAMSEHRNGLLFGTFIQKVVEQELEIQDSDLEEHLAQHRESFMSPEMMRMEGLVFVERKDAESALAKLRSGADFAWLEANASGQAPPETSDDPLRFSGQLLATGKLPEEVARAVAGAQRGDYRFCPDSLGRYHVLAITEVQPSEPLPFEDAKPYLIRRVHAEKLKEATDEWIGRLRAASEIEVFATGEALEQALSPRLSGWKPAPSGVPVDRSESNQD